jgi:AcrR family transcriptional regulator
VDAILFAASHILRSEGPEALTTGRVARSAGVSIGSLYQYFANKEAILAEVSARHRAWLAAQASDGIERGAAIASLRDGVRASIDHMVALQRLGAPLRAAGEPSALSPEALAAFRARTEAYLRENAAALRPLDPALAAAIVTRAAEAVLRGMTRDEPHWLGHSAFVDEVTELVVGYLAPRA